jgi:hypothetical protein
MVFMSTQVKYHTSLCHFVSQNIIKTIGNLAKLRKRSVQTEVKVVRHLFSTIHLIKSWNIKNSTQQITF